MNENYPVDHLSNGLPDGPSNGSRDARRVPLELKDFIGPILMSSLYSGVTVPVIFACLGWSNLLTSYIGLSQWLVSKLALIWPALPPQYQMVLSVRGPGHASSFGFMCVALWAWPAILIVMLVRKQIVSNVAPVLIADIGKLFVIIPAGIFFLVLDTTNTTSPARFYADQWSFFYLRQWLFFFGTAAVLAVSIYLVGRILLEGTWRQSS